ncbi:MAG: UvrD-helicase domain-containing protein [Actinomycetota bacterium]
MSAGQRPTPEQEAAIRSHGSDVLLEAGAGTGKTGVLVERYCDLVASDEVSTDSILAFTFTDKAAAQLRERVRLELGRRARESEDLELAQRLNDLLSAFGGAWITTIHGFCRRLLAGHPVAAGIDPRFRVLDASEATRAARSAFDAALEEFLAGDDPEREATVAAYRVDGLREMVVAAHEQLRSRGHPQPSLPEPATPDPLAALAELEQCAQDALGARAERPHHAERLQRILEITAAREQRLPTLEELAPLTLGGSSGPREACDKSLRRAMGRIAELGEGGIAYGHVGELLRLFHRRFGEEKAARSGLDFEDLQLLAVALLRHSEVGELYRQRFTHLLVDEFQDTNRLQLELIEALRDEETTVFQVGDEFQSIYGFRHADLEVFRERRAAYRQERGAKVLPLSGNFRSRPEVIATANAIGKMVSTDFPPLTVAAQPEQAEPLGGGPAVELLLTECDGWDAAIDLGLRVDDRTRPQYVAEARVLAMRLRALAEAGVPRGEMVVLLRAFTRVDAFEEALQRAGLRPYVVGGRGYWSEQQVADVRCLLSVIANPLDDEPLLGALASPACGVLPDTLWLLRRAAGEGRHLWPAVERAVGAWEPELEAAEWLDEIPASDLERLQVFHTRIAALREQGPRLDLEELIERAVAGTGYDLAVLARGPGDLRLSNVRKLMRLAREFEANEGRDLRAFLEFVEFRTGEDDEAVAATEAEDHDGVRVMTIHNAKGLEFPVVAVADLGRGLLQGGRPTDLNLGGADDAKPRVGMRLARLGYPSLNLYQRDALHEEAQQLAAAEELRLFYVAATRARERLLLSGVLAKSRPKEIKPGTAVAERLAHSFEIPLEADSTLSLPAPEPRPGLDASFGDAAVAVQVNRATPERVAELIRVTTAAPVLEPLGAAPPPIVAPRAPVTPRQPLSYSALEAYRRCGYRFYMERVLDLSPVADGAGAAAERRERFGLGNAVHALLEWSAARRWVEPSEEVAGRFLRAEGLDSGTGHLERARELVGGWISSPLRAELSQRGTRLRPEVPLLVELGGSVVRGSLDLLAEPREGPPTVVDYKTDRLEGADPVEHAARYEVQRDLYALAAAAATAADRVRVAYVFLERAAEPVAVELDAAAIEAARARLEATVGEIAAGRFEVTDSPDWPLCHDCPARRRLCSGPASPPS